MTGLSLGCIADDLTGGADLANELQRQGMSAILCVGCPDDCVAPVGAQAVVIALKSRTAPVDQAVVSSLKALERLRAMKAQRIYLKYCSTFDSTDRGNIGPVADALLQALGEDFTIVSPAFPRNGRTVYQGYLFVRGVPLAESPMCRHPLTPMTDSNLVRVLGRQTHARVGLVPYDTVRRGEKTIRQAFAECRSHSVRYAVVDAMTDNDLVQIGQAALDLPLATGASGIAFGLAQAILRSGPHPDGAASHDPVKVGGPCAVLAGSCSAATLGQIETVKGHWPTLKIEAPRLAEDDKSVVSEALAWAKDRIARSPVLLYTSVGPDELAGIQSALGAAKAGASAERALAEIALGLVAAGVRRFIVAGGETAGAVVKALRIKALRIGPEIDPGVPWTMTMCEPRLAFALKSGNFGAPDFFLKALEIAP